MSELAAHNVVHADLHNLIRASSGAELAVGSFTANTTTGTQAVSGVGFTPKAIMFWMSGSAAASGTWQSDVHQAVGFTSGPTESWSIAGASRDGATSTASGRRLAAKAITVVDHDNGQTVIGEADLSSFGADGFTLDWTVAPNAAYGVMFVAIGGSGVSAKALKWAAPSGTGSHQVTGVGFQPDVVLNCVSSDMNPTNTPWFGDHMSVGFGAMDSSGNQWANAVSARDGSSGTVTRRTQRTDRATVGLDIDPNDGSTATEASYVSMDADGFTLNFTKAHQEPHISLCLAGVDAKVGSFAKTTDAAPASQAVTGVGFEPGAVLLSNINLGSSASVTNSAMWVLGGSDGASERTAAQFDLNGQATTQADSIWKNDKAVVGSINASRVIEAEADLDSFDADGFTLNWTTNNAIVTENLYLALR